MKTRLYTLLYLLISSIAPLKAHETHILAPCPNKPNCVSSLAKDQKHAIAPFPIIDSVQLSLDKLVFVIQNLPRTKIIFRDENYLHAEFTSRIFSFVDDVEFLANPSKKVIEVRSASRLGYGDLGVNRQRIEDLRALYDTSF